MKKNQCMFHVKNLAEHDTKQNFTNLPPHKNEQGCILDIFEHKLIINENDLEELRADHCACKLQASVQVSNVNTNHTASQPKQSQTLLFPAKDLKEKDLHPIFGHDSRLLTINSSQKQLRIQAKTPCQSPPEDPNECENQEYG